MILPPASAGCLSGRCCATPSSRGFAASAGSGLQGPWRPCCIAAHPPCAISVCAVMLGGRPRGAGAFDRLCKAALRLLQTMPDTTATRELLARPPGRAARQRRERPSPSRVCVYRLFSRYPIRLRLTTPHMCAPQSRSSRDVPERAEARTADRARRGGEFVHRCIPPRI